MSQIRLPHLWLRLRNQFLLFTLRECIETEVRHMPTAHRREWCVPHGANDCADTSTEKADEENREHKESEEWRNDT